jgi:hypothetical protein
VLGDRHAPTLPQAVHVSGALAMGVRYVFVDGSEPATLT